MALRTHRPARSTASTAPRYSAWFDEPEVTVLDLFTAGARAAFHVRIDGCYSGGLIGQDRHMGRRASLYASGLLTVRHGTVASARIVTDRLGAERRMQRTAEAPAKSTSS